MTLKLFMAKRVEVIIILKLKTCHENSLNLIHTCILKICTFHACCQFNLYERSIWFKIVFTKLSEIGYVVLLLVEYFIRHDLVLK